MEDFDGKGEYRDPEFVWINTAGLGIKFFTSDVFGAQYKDTFFVRDVHNGRLYHFKRTDDRTHLALVEPLTNKIVRSPTMDGLVQIIFGEGFGAITDLELGADGYLYIVSIG